jgi:hypothetical protein
VMGRGFLIHFSSQHSCGRVLSLDDEQGSNTQRKCRPRHNQDERHFELLQPRPSTL